MKREDFESLTGNEGIHIRSDDRLYFIKNIDLADGSLELYENDENHLYQNIDIATRDNISGDMPNHHFFG
jgi:hypothetical protein